MSTVTAAFAFLCLIGFVYASCPENEHMPQCVPCGENCSDPKDMMCTMDCKEPQRCYCQPGFKRNGAGHCVPEAECEQAVQNPGAIVCTGAHEVVPPCVPCKVNCQDASNRFCPLICMKPDRCFCENNYLRAIDGTCIKEQDCIRFRGFNRKCGLNEEVPMCVPCTEQCYDIGRKMCALMCTSNIEERCFCKSGFARGQSGQCISYDQCKWEEEFRNYNRFCANYRGSFVK